MLRGNKRKFGREMQQRKAFTKSLLVALINHGKIRTTEARAKMLKVDADKTVTMAKNNTMASRRLLGGLLGTAGATKMVKEIAPKFTDRKGGYTRVMKLSQRNSDGASMAIIEFVS